MSLMRLIGFATGLVPLLLFFGMVLGYYYRKNLDKKNKLFVIYLCICFIIDILTRIIGEIYNNNLIFIVVFSLLELLFFYYFYKICIYKRHKKIFSIATAVASVYMLYEMYTLNDVSPYEFQPYSKVLCSFLIIIMSINTLFEHINKEKQDTTIIKLCSVFVVYFSLNLIFFLPVSFLININVNSSTKFYFWLANLILTILFYIFLIKEIWKNGSTRKPLQSGL